MLGIALVEDIDALWQKVAGPLFIPSSFRILPHDRPPTGPPAAT